MIKVRPNYYIDFTGWPIKLNVFKKKNHTKQQTGTSDWSFHSETIEIVGILWLSSIPGTVRSYVMKDMKHISIILLILVFTETWKQRQKFDVPPYAKKKTIL